jgi:hypothetical protein
MAAAHSNAVSTANTKRAGGFRLGLIGVNADVALVSLLTAFKRASRLINGEFMGSCSFQTEGREQGATWGLAFCPSASSLNAEFSRGVRKKRALAWRERLFPPADWVKEAAGCPLGRSAAIWLGRIEDRAGPHARIRPLLRQFLLRSFQQRNASR